MAINNPEQLVEIRIRQQDNPEGGRISCTGSFYCALIAAPDLLTVDGDLGMCAVRDGDSITADGILFSTGPLSVDQVPNAVTALAGCDSEAVVIVDNQGALHDAQNPAAIQAFAVEL